MADDFAFDSFDFDGIIRSTTRSPSQPKQPNQQYQQQKNGFYEGNNPTVQIMNDSS